MDEIEVVVQAFAAIPQQISSPSALVVPGPVGRTGLQSRKDVHQPGLFSTLLEDLLDAVFLAKILLANVLDLQTIGLCNRFCMCNYLFMQRLRKLGIIKNANALPVEVAGHALGIAQGLQTARQNHPVKAVQGPIYDSRILF